MKRVLSGAIGLVLACSIGLGSLGIVTRADSTDANVAITTANFKDANFCNLLKAKKYDANEDGSFSDEELKAITKLDVSGKSIAKLDGIQYFTELIELDCSGNEITTLDVSSHTKLEKLDCSDNPMTQLSLMACPKLMEVIQNAPPLETTDVGNSVVFWYYFLEEDGVLLGELRFPKDCELDYQILIDETTFPDEYFREQVLKYTDTNKNKILDIGEISKWRSLSVSSEKCVDLTGIEYFTALTKIDLYKCKLTTLDLSHNRQLEHLETYDCYKLATLDVTHCPKLNYLEAYCSSIKSLDVTHNPELEVLNLMLNGIEELDITNCPKLKELNINMGNLPSLDLSNCPELINLRAAFQFSLKSLDLSYTPKLRELAINESGIKKIELYHCPALVDVVQNGFLKEDTWYSCLFYWYSSYAEDGEEYFAYTPGTELILEDPNQVVPDPITPDPVTPDPVTPDPVDPDPNQPEPGNPDPSNPNPDPTNPQPVKEPSFEEFIDRLYLYALLREPEADGKAFWMNKVLNEGFTGGRCAYGFLVEAQEFLNRDLTNEQFIDTLYQIFFDRAPDEGGKAFWLEQFGKGMTRAEMVNGFIDSTEWCNLCASYGVKSGAPNAKAEKPSNNAIKFATRLYTECLGREYDADGLQFWALRLTNLESSGYEAALGFFTSEEFTQKGIGDDEFIHRLYRTFMGRDEDADGFAFWKSHLGVDMTREDLVKGFAQSQEFANICNQYGIDKGI